jgi:hypothetical protein
MKKNTTRGKIIILLILIMIGLGSQGSEFLTEEMKNSVSDYHISRFKIDHGDIDSALRSLRLIAPEIIVFGFEKVADIDGVKDNLITIDVTDTSLGKIIQLITKQDPRYYYDIVGNRLIEVYPVGSKKESTNLLNLRIDKVFIEEKCAPTRIISRFPEYLPELSYLIKKSGTLVGAEMRGNMDPEIRINLHNVKVRE